MAFSVLWLVNLVNFMDGIDWITVVEIVPITATLALFGWLGAMPSEATVMALALCGAMLGFAPFNRPVAKLFLGDVGSLPLGLLLGWLLILLAAQHFVAALLLPLYYLADATITLLRRLVRGERVTQAHRRHYYQQAVDGTLSVPQVVGRILVVNAVLAGLAAASLFAMALIQAILLICGSIVVAILLAGFSRAGRAAH
jgi:UDP-N-acetylmuramyl pentapeptide phosphotransferase/UDP-N-acetylglucosamine-1-phosphate transferase